MGFPSDWLVIGIDWEDSGLSDMSTPRLDLFGLW